MLREKIVCSAVKIEGISKQYDDLYLGLRHHNCFNNLTNKRKLLSGDDTMRVELLRNATQGFLTTRNRFVDRLEAMFIAKKAHQIIAPFGNGNELYSECLY